MPSSIPTYGRPNPAAYSETPAKRKPPKQKSQSMAVKKAKRPVGRGR